jgi:hypothetical protein
MTAVILLALDLRAASIIINSSIRLSLTGVHVLCTINTSARGYGGHCFPKDVTATIRSAQVAGGRITILEEADNYNQQVRKDPT